MAKLTKQEYVDLINSKKWEVHNAGGNELEINAATLMAEAKDAANLKVAGDAMKELLLEGDKVLKSCVGRKDYTVLFYCDNLDASRRKLSEIE